MFPPNFYIRVVTVPVDRLSQNDEIVFLSITQNITGESMNLWSELLAGFREFVPLLAVLALVSVVLWLVNWLMLKRRKELGAETQLPRQLLMIALTAVGLLLIVLVFPMSDNTRGQVLSLIGVVLTAVIALSSTTFVANIMAGLMLRVVKSFRPGDFIHIGDQFGRITERGLFHTEIQTEDRNLTTFPNLYLVTNPVTVVRSSGTIVSAELSLGYDLPHSRIEELLKEAASQTDLQEPFVQVRELGDFSVTYRVAGFLTNVKLLLTARSDLRKNVLDVLHAHGVEIVSPAFMNQRRLPEDGKVIPDEVKLHSKKQAPEPEEAPENLIFDKAEEAEALENLRKEYAELNQRLEELKKERKSAEEADYPRLDAEIASLEKKAVHLAKKIDTPRQNSD